MIEEERSYSGNCANNFDQTVSINAISINQMLQDKNNKILWNFLIQTDNTIEMRKPDFIIIRRSGIRLLVAKWQTLVQQRFLSGTQPAIGDSQQVLLQLQLHSFICFCFFCICLALIRSNLSCGLFRSCWIFFIFMSCVILC